MKYTDEYFEDQAEIAKFEQKFLKCIEGEGEPYYHVLMLAFLNCLVWLLKSWMLDGEVMKRWHGERKKG